MKGFITLAVGIGLMAASAVAYAQNNAPATDSVVLVKSSAEPRIPPPQAEFEPPLISGSNVHKLLGLATVGAAGATFLTHHHDKVPPRARNDTHATLGKATAVLATATVISGLITHWDDFAKEDGLSDPDNLHVLLGAGGAALMAYAINKSMNSKTPVSHAELAELGAASMILAIKLTW